MGKFNAAIKNIAEKENLNIKYSFSKTIENTETLSNSLLVKLSKSNEFGILPCENINSLINELIESCNLSLNNIKTIGEEFTKISHLFSKLETEKIKNLSMYEKFIIQIDQPTWGSFLPNKQFLTGFLIDQSFKNPPIEFLIYLIHGKLSGYIPLYDNNINIDDENNKTNINNFALEHLSIKYIGVKSLIFYNESLNKLSEYGTIRYNEKINNKEINTNTRKYIGTFEFNELSDQFRIKHNITKNVLPLYVSISSYIAEYFKNNEFIALFDSIDWNNNKKIQNSEFDIENNEITLKL